MGGGGGVAGVGGNGGAAASAGDDSGTGGTAGASGIDGGLDADVDASLDAGEDASVDAGVDASPEAAPEASPDATPDAPPPTDSGPIVYGIPSQSCDGMTGTECQGKSCCSNILVPGGTFLMGRCGSTYAAVTCTDGYNGQGDEVPEHDATVSEFYLDEYEVTVGRFRKFVEQFDGTPPPDGAAAHPLIPGSGWQAGWSLASSQATLIGNVKCLSTYETWRDTPNGTEELPIGCVNWYEAFAFCAWDGGRLPTETEWEYAAAGGDENRLYPWGSATPENTLAAFDCLYAGTSSCAFEDIAEVGSLPAGAGRWGHKDLAGNMYEWALDWYDSGWYAGGGAVCDDCANLNTDSNRVVRGGFFSLGAGGLRAANRDSRYPTNRYHSLGFRCARIPQS